MSAPVKKLPAYGKALADRLAFGNVPRLVIVAVGGDAWERAKQWNLQNDVAAMVLTSQWPLTALEWPVKGCLVVIEYARGIADALLADLVKCLLKAGAVSATTRPTWVNFDEPTGYYIKTETALDWVQELPAIRTFRAGRSA